MKLRRSTLFSAIRPNARPVASPQCPSPQLESLQILITLYYNIFHRFTLHYIVSGCVIMHYSNLHCLIYTTLHFLYVTAQYSPLYCPVLYYSAVYCMYSIMFKERTRNSLDAKAKATTAPSTAPAKVMSSSWPWPQSSALSRDGHVAVCADRLHGFLASLRIRCSEDIM